MRSLTSLLAASLLLGACSQPTLERAPVTEAPLAVEQPADSVKVPAPSEEPVVAVEPTAPDPATQNLWQLLVDDFELSQIDHARIDAQVRWLKRYPRYLLGASENAEPYLYYISQQLDTHGMPSELALLPIVESAYRIKARSPYRAAGLWQFMPATGRGMGLRQDWWYDGRLDVIQSTQAAIEYLSRLHNEFDDWLLALAAYNTGEGNVRKAIRRNKRRGKPTDYWSLDLARETDIYVPRLLAIAKVLEEQGAVEKKLHAIPNTPYFQVVDIGSQLEMARAAELADISGKELIRLNAAFKRWTTAPAGPHRLLIPVAQANTFGETLAALPQDQRVRWAHYQVKRGDTLSHIAQRYGTSVASLKKLNKLRSNRIRVRQQLLIPSAASAQAIASSQAYAAEGPLIHKVRAGDSLWTIARRYDTSVKQLARLNNISTKSVLRIGQRLRVRG
jgi:membrane-bound lytic murein transglycosylase D